MLISRRNFLVGSTAAVMAPAIVRADSLMPVKDHNPFPIVFYEGDRRLWRLPEGLKVNTYPMGGFGFFVPPGSGSIIAVHRDTKAIMKLRSENSHEWANLGWVPEHKSVASFAPGQAHWSKGNNPFNR